MSTATTVQAHIAHELIEHPNYQVVVIEFASQEITTAADARELGAELSSLIRHQPLQYFVIDCFSVRSLGSAAFSEILSFVHKAKPVWVCNLDNALWHGAFQVGLDNWVRCAASRGAAIDEAERTARWDEEDTMEYSARAHSAK
jgi:hypothetical protein